VATLNIPNTIDDSSLVEASEHQQNYDSIKTFANTAVIHTDGTKGMNVGAQLLLGVAATAALGAVTKAQMDTAVSTATTAAIATAASAATTKANAAAVTGTANAKTYTDSVRVYTGFTEDVVGTSFTSSTTIQTVLDTSQFTPTKAGHAIIVATIDIEVLSLTAGSLDVFIAELWVDGVANSKNLIWKPNAPAVGDRQTMSQTWIVPRANANAFDVKLRCKQAGANQGRYRIVGADHTYLQCLMVG
jgi:hypothetical protein